MKLEYQAGWRYLYLGLFSAGYQTTNTNESFKKRLDKWDNRYELVSVQIYFRHGARTPGHLIEHKNKTIPEAYWEPHLFTKKIETCSQFPSRIVDLNGMPIEETDSSWDRYTDSHMLPGGAKIGQLTCLGQEQMFNLGMKYKRRYADYLDSERYIYCRSSRIRRTLLSMKCLITGLFYDKMRSSKTKVIDIHAEDYDSEILFPNSKLCPKLDELFAMGMHKVDSNGNFQKCSNNLKDILQVSELKSILRNQRASLQVVRDDFQSRQCHGFLIGKEMESYMPTLSKLAAKQISYEVFGGPVKENLDALQYNVGLVLKDILSVFEEAKQNTLTHKLKLFCCHDALIISLLVAFGVYNYDFPDFGSDLVMEIYKEKETDECWFQLFYCGEKINLKFCYSDQHTGLSPLVKVEQHLNQYSSPCDKYKMKCQA